jgi:23S rRNA pseudouridine1911/1915/1917 synthase
MEPEILFEDADILAINKPAGLVVHPDGKTIEPSISEWFVNTYPEAKNVGEPLGDIARPGIVHRIDRETSGVLLLAKTAEGYRHLKEQFQAHAIEKKYHAFLYGKLKDDHGTINMPIMRSKSDFRKRLAIPSTRVEGRGEVREALTYFQVLKRTSETTLVEAKPKTGRTHQIRVHFKALHHPVVCDSLYAVGKPPLLGFSRLALHARSVRFNDLHGKAHTVEAPYPEDFKQAIEQIA